MKKFIAYFDYLGFKQFIENNDLDYQKRIMGNNFRDMESALVQGKLIEASHGVIADLSKHSVNCINFSDTVVFWTNDDSIESLSEILEVTYKFNWQATLYFFPARGALVHGEMIYVDFKNENSIGGVYNINSVFGKGLVTAHQKAESQQWSGAVIDESVIKQIQFKGLDPESILSPYAKKYKIPYKNDVSLEEEFAFCIIKGDLNKIAFDNSVKGIKTNFANHKKDIYHKDVQQKIENTIIFLESFMSKTAFSEGDYRILIEYFNKNEMNQFYLFIIQRVLLIKEFTESNDKVIPALTATLADKVGRTSVGIDSDEKIILLVETLYQALMLIDIKEIYNSDI